MHDNKKSRNLKQEIFKPQSLRNLEKEMSFTLLGFLEHETSLANVRDFGVNAGELLDIKQALESRLGRRAVTQPMESVATMLERRRQEVREACRQNLIRHLGEMVERHNATSGWVFLFNPSTSSASQPQEESERKRSEENTLSAVASYNAPSPTRRYSLDRDKGVIVTVAKTKDVYRITHEPDRDPNYVELVPSTISEVAVPIFAPSQDGKSDQESLIGVLNLEANYPNAFSAAVPLQLTAQATVFGLDLLCMQAWQQNSLAAIWHPSIHGWSFRNVIDTYCSSIAEALPTENGTASLACAAWYYDHYKQRLFVRGNAGFDFEYISNRTLSTESAIGKACEEYFEDKIYHRYLKGHQLVFDIHEFRRRSKARRMELRSVGIFPFSCKPIGAVDKSIIGSTGQIVSSKNDSMNGGALVFYGFEHQYGLEGISVPHLLNSDIGARLARQFSMLIDKLRMLRLRAATTHLNSQMRTEITAGRNPYEVLVRVLKLLFDADGVTVFSVRTTAYFEKKQTAEENEKFLKCEATTGLVSNAQDLNPPGADELFRVPNYRSKKNSHKISDDPKKDAPKKDVFSGFTNYLAWENNSIIRKNDVRDMFEPVKPHQFNEGQIYPKEEIFLIPNNKVLESHAPAPGEHMRFLGGSVGTVIKQYDCIQDPEKKNAENNFPKLDPLNKKQDQILAVVRITRSSTRPPYTESDEELLACILDASRDIFDETLLDHNEITKMISINKKTESVIKSIVFDHKKYHQNAKKETGSQAIATLEFEDNLSIDFANRFGSSGFDNVMRSLNTLFDVVSNILSKDKTGSKSEDELSKYLIRLLFEDPNSPALFRLTEKERFEFLKAIETKAEGLFSNWRKTWIVTSVARKLQSLQTRRAISLVSSDCDIAVLLQDVAMACEELFKAFHPDVSQSAAGETVVLSCLRLVEPTNDHLVSIRMFDLYTCWSKEPAEEDQGDSLLRGPNQEANGWEAVFNFKPMIFRCERGHVANYKHRVHDSSKWVTYGVIIPFKTFSFGRVLEGVLSVDFARDPDNSQFDEAVVKTLSLATRKCAWIIAASELSILHKTEVLNLDDWREKVFSKVFNVNDPDYDKESVRLTELDDQPVVSSFQSILMNQMPMKSFGFDQLQELDRKKFYAMRSEIDSKRNDSFANIESFKLEVNSDIFFFQELVRYGCHFEIFDNSVSISVPLVNVNYVRHSLTISLSTEVFRRRHQDVKEWIRVRILEYTIAGNSSFCSAESFIDQKIKKCKSREDGTLRICIWENE